MFIQLDHNSIEQCRDGTHAVLPESNVHMAIAAKGIHAISSPPPPHLCLLTTRLVELGNG
jgi:hypothetical protein